MSFHDSSWAENISKGISPFPNHFKTVNLCGKVIWLSKEKTGMKSKIPVTVKHSGEQPLCTLWWWQEPSDDDRSQKVTLTLLQRIPHLTYFLHSTKASRQRHARDSRRVPRSLLPNSCHPLRHHWGPLRPCKRPGHTHLMGGPLWELVFATLNFIHMPQKKDRN